MRKLRNHLGLLARGLAVAISALSLVAASLGGNLCEASCEPAKPIGGNSPLPAAPPPYLPESPAAPHCPADSPHEEQVVSPRHRTEESAAPGTRNARSPSSAVRGDGLSSGIVRMAFRRHIDQPATSPLYVRHAAFLI